jgi:hypothetical protein
MTLRTLSLIAATALVALIAAGCGSSSSSTSSSSTTSSAALSKPEFIAKADAICKQGNQAIGAAAKKAFPSKPSKAELNQFASATVLPAIQGEVDAIGALTPPAGDEDQVNQIVTDVQAALDQAKKDPSVLIANNPGVFAKANKEAKAYGLKVCGS